MKKIVIVITMLFLVACNLGKNKTPTTDGNGKGTNDGTVIVDTQCDLDFSNLKTNADVALMFNAYRERCNPSDSQLNAQLNKLEQQLNSKSR